MPSITNWGNMTQGQGWLRIEWGAEVGGWGGMAVSETNNNDEKTAGIRQTQLDG